MVSGVGLHPGNRVGPLDFRFIDATWQIAYKRFGDYSTGTQPTAKLLWSVLLYVITSLMDGRSDSDATRHAKYRNEVNESIDICLTSRCRLKTENAQLT